MRPLHLPRLQTLSTKAYVQLLRLYPRSYRQKYAADMQRTFEDCCRFVLQERGNSGLFRLWMPTLADLSLTVVEKHLDEGWLSSGRTMIRGVSFALLGAASLLYAVAWDIGPAFMLIATLLFACGVLGLFLTSPNARDILRRRFDKTYSPPQPSPARNGQDDSGRDVMFNFERGFWLKWLAASGLGLALGFSVYIGLTVRFAEDFALGVQWLIAAGSGLLFGAAIGIAQWMVLRQRIPQPNHWIVSSVVGGAVGGTLELLIRYQLTGDNVGYYRMAIGSAVIGSALGIAGWLVLRRYVSRASRWIPASAAGLFVAIALSNVLGRLLYEGLSGTLGDGIAGSLAMVIFGGLLLTAYGGITGAALIWLFKQPNESRPELSHGAA